MKNQKKLFLEKRDSFLGEIKNKIAFYAKEYPKEIFLGLFGLLTISVMITFFNLYNFEERERTPMYVHPVSDIGDELKETENTGIIQGVPSMQGFQNPITLYSKIEKLEILNKEIQGIQMKQYKTAQDSLRLIEIYNTLKTLSNE